MKKLIFVLFTVITGATFAQCVDFSTSTIGGKEIYAQGITYAFQYQCLADTQKARIFADSMC